MADSHGGDVQFTIGNMELPVRHVEESFQQQAINTRESRNGCVVMKTTKSNQVV